jgi:hypothetical protein
MLWSPRFKLGTLPRLRRWRLVLPEAAGIGQVPAKTADAASDRTRPRWDHAVMRMLVVLQSKTQSRPAYIM